MEYKEAISQVAECLQKINCPINTQDYDSVMVKKMTQSNLLLEGRTSHQTHIAITGEQIDMFPYLRADGYFDNDESALKKFFYLQTPVSLHKRNFLYLQPGIDSSVLDHFSGDKVESKFSIIRSKRKDQSEQIQLSLIDKDGEDFITFRRLLKEGDYIVLLKEKERFSYDAFGVKSADAALLESLNNKFYYDKSVSTNIQLPDDLSDNSPESDSTVVELEKFSHSRDCALKIVDFIYKLDRFQRLYPAFVMNDSYIKIDTGSMGGNYLRYTFARPQSDNYVTNDGSRRRVFENKIFKILIDGKEEDCRLTTEWKSSSPQKDGASGNYLGALIQVVNEKYHDILNIYESDGTVFIKQFAKLPAEKFELQKLPEIFKKPFARRYITSLLAKPFVILTGNSGTGKTRITKQFAEYLEVECHGGKNWALVPVGADWTDNTRILGFYNPLADDGKGRYEKTEILKLIERANENKDIPFFLILDEMNLSHVERYFADFLSHMETPDLEFKLDGYDGYVNNNGEKIDTLKYPSNLFVVGTVNIDETTYMFSPKVLDRANVIEFKPSMDSVLDLFDHPASMTRIVSAGKGMAEGFLKLADEIRNGKCKLNDMQIQGIKKLFGEVYTSTEKSGYEFAYRSVKEIRQYISAAYELESKSFDHDALVEAEDEELLQKVLPKIHGNKKEIGELLENLENLCKKYGLDSSMRKIDQMKGKLAQVQYASFI
jgi:MoxR-like ATPase